MGRAPRRLIVCVVAAATLLTLLLAIQARERVLVRQHARHSTLTNDFARWLVMTPQFLQQHADYVNDSFPNPPVTLLVIAPFTRLSPANAQFLWACGKAVLAAMIFLLGRRMVRAAGVELTRSALLGILAVWLWPVFGDVQEGQTNLLMLLPLVAGLALAQVEQPGADGLAGLLVALAVAIKVTPVAFLPYFLFRRRWTLTLAASLGLIVWFVVIPGLAFGWEQNLKWLGQWCHIMIVPYVARGHVVYPGGQSLASLLSRTLRHVPPISSGASGEALPYYFNVVDLPAPVVGWIIRGVLLAIVVAGVFWARRPVTTFRSQRYVLEIGAIAAFMLWASERTWVPHYVTLVLTLFAVGMVLSNPAESETVRHRAWWALVLAACLMAFTGDLGKIFGPHGNKFTRTLGVSLWASVVLVAAIVPARGDQCMKP
jgi:hypothetical protein